MDVIVGSENGQLQRVFFKKLSLASCSTNDADINFSLLPKDPSTTSGTGYPPIRLLAKCEVSQILSINREGGAIEFYSLKNSNLVDQVIFPFEDGRQVVSLDTDPQTDSSFMAISNQGEIALFSHESEKPTVSKLPGISDVKSVARLGQWLAVGGKGVNNNLQVWDLKALNQPLFAAKQAMNKRLNQMNVVDIRSVVFPDPERNDLVVVGNHNGQILVYDFKKSRLPILERQALSKKAPVHSLLQSSHPDQVLLTNTDGVIELYDFQKGRSLGRFGPHEGALTFAHLTAGLKSAKVSSNLLITACKDRFLRIFDFKTRKLVSKLYLKHVPTAFSLISEGWLEILAKEYESSDDEELWENLDTVKDSKRQKKDEAQ